MAGGKAKRFEARVYDEKLAGYLYEISAVFPNEVRNTGINVLFEDKFPGILPVSSITLASGFS